MKMYEADQRIPESAVKASGTTLACQYGGLSASYAAFAAAHSSSAKNLIFQVSL